MAIHQAGGGWSRACVQLAAPPSPLQEEAAPQLISYTYRHQLTSVETIAEISGIYQDGSCY